MSDFSAKIVAQLDTSKIPSQLAKIQSMISKQKFVITVDTSATKNINQVTNAFNDLMKLQNRINSTRIKLAGLDSNKDSAQIKELSGQLNRLMADYNNLHSTFSKSFSTNQLDALNRGFETASNKISVLNAKASDTKSVAKLERSFTRLMEIANQMGKIQVKINGLDATKNSAEITQLVSQFRDLESQYNRLKTSLNGKISDVQSSQLSNELKNAQNQLAQLEAKIKDVKHNFSESINLKISVGSFSTQIDKYEQSFRKYGLSIADSKQKVQELRNILSQLETSSEDNLPANWKNWENAILKVKTELDQAKLSYDKFAQPASENKIVTTQNRIQKMLQNNTRATDEMRAAWQRYEQELNGSVSEERLHAINLELSKNEYQLRESGKWGKSFIDKFSDIGQIVASYVSLQRAIDLVIDKTREAVNELKEIDTLIVEISKANDNLSKKDLERIRDNSFGTASKYGKKATDYLLGVQEMSRAGYKDAEGIAELSVAVQGAGDVTAETANQYVIATDKAYKLNGAVDALTKVFDGSNYITNNNAVNMQELAEGMSIVGSTAASLGVDVDETTAAIGTMSASTQQSGSEVARAFKAILLNIRQVSDEDENIDSEGLTKYEKACNALGVKLKETKDGVLALRDPMEVLKELSTEYNKLDESDIRRTNLLSSVGGKLRSTQLDALLRNWDMYEKMLSEYKAGTGSMAVEAEKTANSWEGSLNRLSNTWTSTINNIADSDVVTASINGLNGILGIINKITGALGTWGTVGTVAAIALNKKLD